MTQTKQQRISTYQDEVGERARSLIEKNGGWVVDKNCYGCWLLPETYVYVLLPSGTTTNEKGYVLPDGSQIYGHYRWDQI